MATGWTGVNEHFFVEQVANNSPFWTYGKKVMMPEKDPIESINYATPFLRIASMTDG